MEFSTVVGSDTPTWVKTLAERLERGGKVGLLAYRNNDAKRNDLTPAVYIGCSYNGNSSNYSTNVSDMLYSMSSLDNSVNTFPCDNSKYLDFISVLPSYIVGKYHAKFRGITAFVSGHVVLAMCDMNSKEIFIPDVNADIYWHDSKSHVIEMIDDLVSDIVDRMESAYLDYLIRNIEIASQNNTHVETLLVKAETKFDKSGFVRDCMDALKSYEIEIDSTYREVFENMRRDLRIAQGQGVIDALELMTYMKERKFIFVNPGMLKYTGGRITANTGVYEDALYKTKSELWISGLRVIIEDGIVAGARCYRAYHPNCSGRHVCLGELVGIPIRDVTKVVDAMKVPNFSNGYWSHSGDYVSEKIVDIEGDSERVWSDY